jgi:hypothetical protein
MWIYKNTILQMYLLAQCVHISKNCFHYRILVIFAMTYFQLSSHVVERFLLLSVKAIRHEVFFNCAVLAQMSWKTTASHKPFNRHVGEMLANSLLNIFGSRLTPLFLKMTPCFTVHGTLGLGPPLQFPRMNAVQYWL